VAIEPLLACLRLKIGVGLHFHWFLLAMCEPFHTRRLIS
jgi:hypothetical protein